MNLKVIFEAANGERVERELKTAWSTEVMRDLKSYKGITVGEDMKQILANTIAECINPEFVMSVLTEFENKT